MVYIVLHKDSAGAASVIYSLEIINDDGKIRICGLQSQNVLVRG